MDRREKETFVITVYITKRFFRNEVDDGHMPPTFRDKFNISDLFFKVICKYMNYLQDL